MASQRQSVDELYEVALELTPQERAVFLNDMCRNSPEIKESVEKRLLENDRAEASRRRSSSGSEENTSDSFDTVTEPDSLSGSSQKSFVSNRINRFLLGDVIGERFLVIRFIACGGMGEVYEVEDRFLDDVRVALKMILPKFASDESTLHRFQQEVVLARKVAHPNICPIYDIFHCKDPAPPFSFLTMRLLPGDTLAARLRRATPVPVEEATAIFKHMAAGLAALHAGGIIHRDIKPNNVMLDGVGSEVQLWITDFGLARRDEPEATAYSKDVIAGTRGYMAPELLAGEMPSQASDIFAFGVVMHETFAGEKPRVNPNDLSSVPSPRLKSAEIPPEFRRLVTEFLSDEPERRCKAFQQTLDLFDLRNKSGSYPRSGSKFWTRRRFVGAATVGACAVAGGAVWKWDEIEDMLHPLPLKRFVALLNWPVSDAHVKPILSGVMDAIASELSRAEAFDRNLLVIPHSLSAEPTSARQLNELRETLGANLVLAASGTSRDKGLHLNLQVLDPSSARTLREKTISSWLAESMSLPDKAVEAAAHLLDVSNYRRNGRSARPDTQSPQAYAAFQAAEAFRKQDNDSGLDAAIDKYKEAVELDPRYATAHAKLALAYLRYYFVHGDSAALNLAHGNADTALSLNRNLVEVYMARSLILEQTGDIDGATREIATALSIDPSDPRILVSQGQLLTNLNRWNDAEEALSRVVKLRPNYWLGHEYRGVLFNAEGKYPQAVTEFRMASLAAPKSVYPLSDLASVYLQQGKIAEAKQILKRCLDLGPHDAAESTMAAVLRCEGKPSEALPFGLKAVELGPSDAANWLELGDCYSLVPGHRADALKTYKQAVVAQEEKLRDAPKNGPGLMVLALSEVKSGSPEAAPDLIDRAEQSFAGDLDSQLLKARTLELLGKRQQALSTVEACLNRGATEFQFQTMPDMEALRKDPRYQAIVQSTHRSTETNV